MNMHNISQKSNEYVWVSLIQGVWFWCSGVRGSWEDSPAHPAVNKEVSAYLHYTGVDKFFIPSFSVTGTRHFKLLSYVNVLYAGPVKVSGGLQKPSGGLP